MAFVLTHGGDPFAAIRRDFEQNLGLRRHSTLGAVTVLRGEDYFELHLDVPGLTEEDIEIRFEDGQLYVEAEQTPTPGDGMTLLFDDRPGRRFRRVFRLGDAVDPEHIDAELEHGILKLRLRQREELKPKRIAIRSVSETQPEAKPAD